MPLRCSEIPDRANAYIDRETSVIDYLKVASHLATCPNCRTYVRGLRVTRTLAAASLVAEMPEELRRRLDRGDHRSDDNLEPTKP
ncbi:MAG: zf-HC2 domain-containing protein [Rhizobiaceae bacterium]|nr:zf-HC2 domain-containing protein [Rhizobiaceae bacterium]